MTISPLHAQGQIHQWSQRFGDASEQSGRGIAADPYGNVILSGSFQGTVDLGGGALTSAGGIDIYVAKFDPGGNHLWSQRFGDATYNQRGRSVAIDASGNVIVAGPMAGTVDFGGGPLTALGWDTFVAKFDPSGNHVWSQRFGPADCWGVAVDPGGNVIIVGNFPTTVDFGGGPLTSAGGEDIYVAKFDPSGHHLWSKSFGDADGELGRGVATDPSGNVVVTGWFLSTVNFGGGALTSAGGEDICVAKFDANGDHVWSRRYGDADNQRGYGVATDVAGNVIVANRFCGTVEFGGGPLTSAGGMDIYVAKFDPTGDHLWSQRFGDENDWQVAWGLTTDTSGNVIIGGSLTGTADFGGGQLDGSGFAAKFDPGGNHLWSQAFNNDSQRGGYVAADAFENVIITGAFMGTTDFGGGPLTSAGDFDISLAKFDLSPAVPTALLGFHSNWVGNYVEVAWRLIDLSQEYSFEVSRGEHPSEPIRSMHDLVVYRRGDEFVFEDHTTDPGMTYRYRVIIYEAGEVVTSFVTELNTPSATFALAQNDPNPFNPSTTISFSLDNDTFALLTIYDVAGRLVRTLVNRKLARGRHSEVWDGRDVGGVEVVSGIYFYRLEAGSRAIKKKMLLLK
jgi:hypothetical protein